MASMTRRELLRRLGLALGGSLSAGVVSAVLAGCRGRSAVDPSTLRALDPGQFERVGVLAEIIIPATDTPGARDAGVPEFIDSMLADWLDDEDRERFLSGLTELDAEARRRFGRDFLALEPEARLALVAPLDAEAAELRLAAAREGTEILEMPFFGLMKEMTLVGYYTSEAGLVHELEYTGFTGTFEGCVPLSPPT